jgi:hypothetical protein
MGLSPGRSRGLWGTWLLVALLVSACSTAAAPQIRPLTSMQRDDAARRAMTDSQAQFNSDCAPLPSSLGGPSASWRSPSGDEEWNVEVDVNAHTFTVTDAYLGGSSNEGSGTVAQDLRSASSLSFGTRGEQTFDSTGPRRDPILNLVCNILFVASGQRDASRSLAALQACQQEPVPPSLSQCARAIEARQGWPTDIP